MRKRTVAFTFFALSLSLLSGCAGNSIDNLDNPFLGDWVGTYNSSALGTSGEVDVDINVHGNMVGATIEDGSGKTGQITGEISETGTVNATIEYADGDPTALKGNLTITDGRLTGELTQGTGGASVDISLDLLIRD